mmetsp:Transcript_32725/g.84860  ORF Transcript_32725/g.84860 Transcript_32725/m.84860 type:complete len:94 (+) Transcript_32725:1288-1569(+)
MCRARQYFNQNWRVCKSSSTVLTGLTLTLAWKLCGRELAVMTGTIPQWSLCVNWANGMLLSCGHCSVIYRAVGRRIVLRLETSSCGRLPTRFT